MTEISDKKLHPVRTADVPEQAFEQGRRFGSRFQHLTSAMMGDAYNIGVAIETLEPGKQSCPFHYHMLEEEHILVLEGSCTLRLGDQRIAFQAGQYVVFPAGQKTGHCLINEGDAPCRYLVIGENRKNEVCVYPDSGKVQVSWLKERYSTSEPLDYFDGEEID